MAVPGAQNDGGPEHLELVELGDYAVHLLRPVSEIVDRQQAELLNDGEVGLKGLDFLLGLSLVLGWLREQLLRSIFELLGRVDSRRGHDFLDLLLLVGACAAQQLSDIEQPAGGSAYRARTAQVPGRVEVELALREYLILDLQLHVGLPADVHVLLLLARDIGLFVLLQHVSYQFFEVVPVGEGIFFGL